MWPTKLPLCFHSCQIYLKWTAIQRESHLELVILFRIIPPSYIYILSWNFREISFLNLKKCSFNQITCKTHRTDINVKKNKVQREFHGSMNVSFNDRNAYEACTWCQNILARLWIVSIRLISKNKKARGKIEERASKPKHRSLSSLRKGTCPRIRWKKHERSWKIIFIPVSSGAWLGPKSLRNMGQWKFIASPFPAVQRSNKCRGCCDWSWWDSCCWPAPRYSPSIAIFTKPDRCTVIGPSFSIPLNGSPGRCGWNRAVYEESLSSRGPITIYSPSMFFWVRLAIE